MRWMLVGLVALGGCATIPVAQNQVDAALEGARAVVTSELAYAKLPRCRAGQSWSNLTPCSTLAGVRAIDGLSRIVVADVNQLEANAGAGVANYGEVEALLVAIGNLQSAISVLEK